MRRRGGTIEIIGVGAPEREPAEQDRPEHHQTEGRASTVTAAVLRGVLDDALEELRTVERPPGFVPLSTGVVLGIVRDLAMRRSTLPEGGDAISVVYKPSDASFLGTLGTLGDRWAISGHDGAPPLDRFVVVDLIPSPLPFQGIEYRRRSLADAEEEARRDAKEVAQWHVGPDGRTWRAGTPWPSQAEQGERPALSAADKRQILREVRRAIDDPWPPVVQLERPLLRFLPTEDGVTCYGGGFPLEGPNRERRPNEYVTVRLPVDARGRMDHVDPEEYLAGVAEQLDRVRITPDGTVVLS